MPARKDVLKLILSMRKSTRETRVEAKEGLTRPIRSIFQISSDRSTVVILVECSQSSTDKIILMQKGA